MELNQFFGGHKKCSTDNHGRYAKESGLELLSGFKTVPGFNREGTYQVCELMQRKMKDLQVR